MKITQTSVTERRSGIPAQGWENVRAIIGCTRAVKVPALVPPNPKTSGKWRTPPE
jgi:hypothetical protein